jgi:hypothetical protein
VCAVGPGKLSLASVSPSLEQRMVRRARLMRRKVDVGPPEAVLGIDRGEVWRCVISGLQRPNRQRVAPFGSSPATPKAVWNLKR